MARRNPWFSFESDNDDIDLDQDVLGTDTELDETAVDDAGDDSETVNVTPDTKETAHNELASAGGVATGNNADQLEMDPVAATESFIRRFLGLSREDMEEAVDEVIAEGEKIPDADTANLTGDPDLDDTAVDNGTTVNITSPNDTHIDINAAGDEVEVGTDAELDDNMSASDVAAIEGLRRLWSREDDMDGGGSDVELDVKTSDNDVNLEFEGKAVTIEPNEGGDDMGGDDYGSDDEGGDYGSDDDEGGDYGSDDDEGGDTDYGADTDEGDEGDEETKEGFYFW